MAAPLIWKRVGSFTDSADRLVHKYELEDSGFEEHILVPAPRWEGEVAGIRFHIQFAVSLYDAFNRFEGARQDPEAEIAT